jgi:hypothetical protein
MTSSHTAQGLASLGRNGDSMLMHVSPSEVGGLKQVGDSLGIKMTTNPYTGMPEAFKFGDFLSSFLPTIAGIIAAPATGGFSLAPILAGAGTGAALAAVKGNDPLMGALTGGLGGYGGGQLGPTFGKAFGTTGGTAAGAADDIISAGAQQTTGGAGNVGMFTANNMGTGAGVGPSATFGQAGTYTQAVPNLGVTANTPNPFTGAGGFDPAAKTVAGGGGYSTNPLDLAGDNISNLGSGVKNLTGFGDMSIGDAYGKFTQAGGTATDLAMPIGQAVLSGIEPQTYAGYQDPDKDKYRGPQGQLNLSDTFDTGLRLVAEGGYIDGYATGGNIQSGGIRDLYGTPDNQPTMSTGLGGFGLGRLNDLAGEQAMTQAQTLGYAEGGYLNGKGDGMSDSIPATIEGKQPARLADGEFVVPADVVSHIGNGSSKAGSKRLYAMLDKVRHARTGTKKQGKEINPSKYMPA